MNSMEEKNAACAIRKFFIGIHHSGLLLPAPVAEEANKLYFSLYSQNYDVYKIFLFKKKHLIWLIMKATKSTPWFVT